MTDPYSEIVKEVKQKKEFYINVILWILATLATFAFLTLYNEPMKYLGIVFFGWGAVILVHGLAVFGIPFLSKAGKRWEEKEIKNKLIERSEETLDLNEPRKLEELKKDYNDTEDFV